MAKKKVTSLRAEDQPAPAPVAAVEDTADAPARKPLTGAQMDKIVRERKRQERISATAEKAGISVEEATDIDAALSDVSAKPKGPKLTSLDKQLLAMEKEAERGKRPSKGGKTTMRDVSALADVMDVVETRTKDAQQAAGARPGTDSDSKQARRNRKAKSRSTRTARMIGEGDTDPEAGKPVSEVLTGDEALMKDPEPKRTLTGKTNRSNRAAANRNVQSSALSEGNSTKYWQSVLGRPSALAQGGQGIERVPAVEPTGAYTDLGAKRGDQPVGGFCTNCDSPIMREPQPLTNLGEGILEGVGRVKNQSSHSTRHAGKKFRALDTGRLHTIGAPTDDTLCDTCSPVSQSITEGGIAALQEKFNVARGERG